MSIQCMSWVMQASESEGLDRLVGLVLADDADDEGLSCKPGFRRIAAKAKIAVSTARECVVHLEELGELVVWRPAKTGRGHHNWYALVMGRDPEVVRAALEIEVAGKRSGDERFLPAPVFPNSHERKPAGQTGSRVGVPAASTQDSPERTAPEPFSGKRTGAARFPTAKRAAQGEPFDPETFGNVRPWAAHTQDPHISPSSDRVLDTAVRAGADDEDRIDRVIALAAQRVTAGSPGVTNPSGYARKVAGDITAQRRAHVANLLNLVDRFDGKPITDDEAATITAAAHLGQASTLRSRFEFRVAS